MPMEPEMGITRLLYVFLLITAATGSQVSEESSPAHLVTQRSTAAPSIRPRTKKRDSIVQAENQSIDKSGGFVRGEEVNRNTSPHVTIHGVTSLVTSDHVTDMSVPDPLATVAHVTTDSIKSLGDISHVTPSVLQSTRDAAQTTPRPIEFVHDFLQGIDPDINNAHSSSNVITTTRVTRVTVSMETQLPEPNSTENKSSISSALNNVGSTPPVLQATTTLRKLLSPKTTHIKSTPAVPENVSLFTNGPSNTSKTNAPLRPLVDKNVTAPTANAQQSGGKDPKKINSHGKASHSDVIPTVPSTVPVSAFAKTSTTALPEGMDVILKSTDKSTLSSLSTKADKGNTLKPAGAPVGAKTTKPSVHVTPLVQGTPNVTSTLALLIKPTPPNKGPSPPHTDFRNNTSPVGSSTGMSIENESSSVTRSPLSLSTTLSDKPTNTNYGATQSPGDVTRGSSLSGELPKVTETGDVTSRAEEHAETEVSTSQTTTADMTSVELALTTESTSAVKVLHVSLDVNQSAAIPTASYNWPRSSTQSVTSQSDEDSLDEVLSHDSTSDYYDYAIYHYDAENVVNASDDDVIIKFNDTKALATARPSSTTSMTSSHPAPSTHTADTATNKNESSSHSMAATTSSDNPEYVTHTGVTSDWVVSTPDGSQPLPGTPAHNASTPGQARSRTKSFSWTKLSARPTSPASKRLNELPNITTSGSTRSVSTTPSGHAYTPSGHAHTNNGLVSTTTVEPFIVTVKHKPEPTRFYPKTKPNEIIPGGNTLATPKATEIQVTSPQLFIRLYIKMTKDELCRRRKSLKKMLTGMLVDNLRGEDTTIEEKQVILKPLDDTCAGRDWRKRRDVATERVDTYVCDVNGGYSYRLTSLLALTLQHTHANLFSGSHFDGKVVDIKMFGEVGTVRPDTAPIAIDKKNPGVNVGLVTGIIVGCVVLLAGTVFLGFLMAARWRRRGVKKMRHVTASARPSLNLDTHSLAESIQMQAFNRRGSTRYGRTNPSMHFVSDETELTSNLLNFEDLEQILKRPEIIEDEFLMLPNNLSTLSDLPKDTEDKNRYANVIPNPSSRVDLELSVKEGATTYINANFIKGYQGYPKCYIATQAPLETTVYDFWRMVWQQNTNVIIMLTALTENSVEKCKEYWPNTEGGDTTRFYGEFRISQERRIVMPEWIQTTLQLKYRKAKQQKEIQHFWMTSWPSHGVPDYRTLIKFMVKIRPFMDDSAAPPVIHCSPGTGRTGVFIALDINMLSFEDSGMINVLNTVHEMRKDRGGMVQTKEQYAFIYKVIFEFAKMLNNPISSARSSMSSTGSSYKY